VDENSHPNNEPEPASAASSGGLESNPEVEEFFQRLVEKQEMRRPKPNDEAIAAALQAIQRLTNPEGGAALGDEELPLESPQVPGMLTCSQCGYANQVGNQFCGMCGGRFSETQSTPVQATPAAHSNSGQHHYHHHDHHHYFHGAAEGGLLEAALGQRTPVASTAGKEAVRLRAPAGGASLSKAEATVRQLTQDWAVACNNKQLDDILTFYATDALVLRPNVPPVRGTAAIREFFFSALEAGLGDVEMETLRVELYGDVAYETGRCKMLVPVAMGKRREERGKYVIVFAKQKTGEWQAIVDSWSSDLNLAVASEPTGKAPTAQPVPPKIRR
jgi:ketosteroid isomerase-like protein